MKARLIALAILLVLIGGPIGLYWYFMQKNISSLEIGFGSGITAQVELRGTFSALATCFASRNTVPRPDNVFASLQAPSSSI